METIYIVILSVLVGLSVVGLVVGVSNDAVNFLTSAFGSKVAALKTIFIVASIGILVGTIFSSGMMEIPRSGIFRPQYFHFNEVMYIFMAVILANILLLDFFNTLGLPTSTSVAIVFELLGAAAFIAFVKIYNGQPGPTAILDYLNTSKVLEIIVAILLSVAIAFSLGAAVQYISRLIFTFEYEKKLKIFGALFGGGSLAALTYFIFVNGLSSISLITAETRELITGNALIVLIILAVFWTLVSQFIISVFKADILKVIILTGTFALALAFAANDLVNFIGVPMAAGDAFSIWFSAYKTTGVAPTDFLMVGLADPPSGVSMVYMFIAGILMVITLWTSKKARTVVETSVNLSRQGDGKENFEPNNLARILVRYALIIINAFTVILPPRTRKKIEAKFQKPDSMLNDKRIDIPAFDKIRASVNLVVAAILISLGTNLQLPLSTTYVTFMVAMGTSLSDRAWDRESAVYRVTGVLKVIGGWLITAFAASAGAAVFAALIWFGGFTAILVLSAIAVFMVGRSTVLHSRKILQEKQNVKFNTQELVSIQEFTGEISENITSVVKGINRRYGKVVDHLGYYDLAKLKKDTKKLQNIEEEVEQLTDNVFFFIKNLEENSVEANRFYILFLDHLENMVESIGEITRTSYNHVNNNLKNLKFNQIRDLKGMGREMTFLFEEIIDIFENQSFDKIDRVIESKSFLLDDVSELIQKQIRRIRTSESSRKNTKLYFGLLLETKDLINSAIGLLNLYKDFHTSSHGRPLRTSANLHARRF